MKEYFVSIIIPVYNVEKYLKKCIKSCLSQSYKNIEVIAIDDGSTDSSAMILDEIQKQEKKLRVIHKKNSGVSSARNTGLDIARGDYIIFVDADDYLSTDAVEYMIGIVKKTHADFGILKNCFTSKDQKQFDDSITSITNEDAVSLLLGLDMELGCWNKIYSKSMLEENNIRFNEELFYGEGLYFIIEVAQSAKNIGLGNKSVYYYRKNNLLSATSSFNYKKFENGEKSLIKVKDELKIKNKRIFDTWSYHYSMFAQNVLISCINNKKHIKNYKEIKREWRKKFNKYFGKIIFSKYIDIYEKIKLIIIRISPKLFSIIRNKKNKKMVERSV